MPACPPGWIGLGVVVLRWFVFGFVWCVGSVVNGVLVFGLGSICLAVFPSRVMRFSCLVSDFVMEGWSLVLVSLMGGLAIGHIVCTRRLYSSMALTTSFAALSIWSVVAWLEPRRF